MQRYILDFKGCTGLQDEPQGEAQGRCTVQRLVGESENLKRVTRIPKRIPRTRWTEFVKIQFSPS